MHGAMEVVSYLRVLVAVRNHINSSTAGEYIATRSAKHPDTHMLWILKQYFPIAISLAVLYILAVLTSNCACQASLLYHIDEGPYYYH